MSGFYSKMKKDDDEASRKYY